MSGTSEIELLDLLLNYWEAIAGFCSVLGAAFVLWLSTKFPRRKEFDARTTRLHNRLDALEQRMDKNDLLMEKVAGQLGSVDVSLKSIDEKIGWRFVALENQVTILLRGHLEWEDK